MIRPPIRIVIAEDQALVLGALAALLAWEDDFSVVGRASDGREALAQVRSLRPDILLADVEMPGLNGLELAQVVEEEGTPTKVVLVTTFARPGYLTRARAVGVRGYLLKDAPAEDLAAAIRTVHGGGVVVPVDLAAEAQVAGADPLTPRERDVLRLADEGLSNRSVAARLGLAAGTVRNYLSTAAGKLGAANRTEAGRIARRTGWL